jgi:hypothetical protein
MAFLRKFYQIILSDKVQCILAVLLAGILLGLCFHVLADGTDVLQGTTRDATSTIQGSGKKWLYAYIKTKNIFVLGGVAVVAIFLNIVLKLAGSSS